MTTLIYYTNYNENDNRKIYTKQVTVRGLIVFLFTIITVVSKINFFAIITFSDFPHDFVLF
jgi:hypothetical protein